MRKILTKLRFHIAMLMLLSVALLSAQQPDYGLHVKSYPVPNNERTSVLLDDGKPIALKGKRLTLKFDLRLREDNVLGTAVRIITDNGKNVDLLYSIEDNQRYPNLVTGDKANLQLTLPPYDKWVPVSIQISPSSGDVELNYNGTVTTASYPDLKGAKSVRMVMGLSTIEGFRLNDQASIDIRDVEILLGKDKIREWKFKAHLDNCCLDEIHQMPATVNNPQWIADETATWEKIFERRFSGFPSVAFDPVIATFYMVSSGSDRLLVFHSPEGVTDTIVTHGKPHLSEWPNQLIFIPRQHILLSYNIDENRYARFEPDTQTWYNGGETTKDHDFWNNSVSYNPVDSTLVSFGGYGHYKFNNLMVTCFPFAEKPEDSEQLIEIAPRRSCATTIVANHLYIYGGWGCPSGRQELDTRNYYDLYRVNLYNNKVEKMWSLEKSPFDSDFTCLENMIYEPKTDSFLMLSTLDNGTLIRMKRTTGEMEKMSYPMNLTIDSHLFYGNFYFSQEQNKYFAAVVESQTDGVTYLTIHELPAPASPVASLTQERKETSSHDNIWTWICIICGILLLAGIATAVYHSKKKSNKTTFEEEQERSNPNSSGNNASSYAYNDIRHIPIHDHTDVNTQESEETLDEEETSKDDHSGEDSSESEETADDTPTETEVPTTTYYDLNRSCVRLFGNFQVFDKEGNDITALFTPTLKHLLLVLILYTGKNPNGISSKRLFDIIWPDKEYESAKNNRNVYLSRLRPILQQIGDISIGTNNGFRNIIFGEGTICDYLEFTKISHQKNPDDNEKALELLLHGMLLPNVEEDYVDSFKSDFSNEAIDFLTKMLRRKDLSVKQQMKVADIIFEHDFVNEEALQLKCRILHRQGRTGMARSVYNSFCREYNTLMGKPYPRPFNEVIGG